MPKTFLYLIILILGYNIASAQTAQPEKYSRLKVFINEEILSQLHCKGVTLDHLAEKEEEYIVGEFSESEIKAIENTGAAKVVLIEDLSRYYVEENQKRIQAKNQTISTQSIPQGFNFGSIGGFLSYDEMVQELDSLALMYPNLVSIKSSIGNTVEGRPMWMIKLSDNPNIDESEPEIFYNAMHHAREPQSMMQLFYFMYYLLENYGIDPEATYLLNNRELFFVPIVNPDGYVYNEQTNPLGGGMWRKNRRDNGDGSFGVDLNRNYGFQWGINDQGSSPDTYSYLYRGIAPFSEPETQNMRDFILSRNFHNVMNYHSYGDYELYPWGYDFTVTEDSILLNSRARAMVKHNDYVYGPASLTLYPVNGEANDWLYGDTLMKPKILGMTPEIGKTGFWPTQDEIVPLSMENLGPNLLNAWFAGEYIHVDVPKKIYWNLPIYTFNLPFQNLGNEVISGASISIKSQSPWINSISLPQPLNNIVITQAGSFTSSIDFVSNIPLGTEILAKVQVKFASGDSLDIPFHFIWGTESEIWNDEFLTANNWTGTWAITNETAQSPPYSLTDSPNSWYAANYVSSTTSIPIDLAGYVKPTLYYKVNCQIELGTRMWITVEDVLSMQTISYPADQTISRNGDHQFVLTRNNWKDCVLDLSAFEGKKIKITFQLESGNNSEDGYYLDDISIKGIQSINSAISFADWFDKYYLYPNPTDGKVSLNKGKEELKNLNIELVTLTGKSVVKETIENYSLDFSQLPKGIYMYRFMSEDKLGNWQKLIIE